MKNFLTDFKTFLAINNKLNSYFMSERKVFARIHDHMGRLTFKKAKGLRRNVLLTPPYYKISTRGI